MKIKKISIHGFKSFVDKTVLEFSKGTSGIIGPNGCGKSNIVDAIRWVIGEQNPRHLRGKNMEDVIFNGSDLRKPLGMAEVVLTFVNDSGSAPARYADFTEIEISRRLYRSGESEYYINKVQSRLRDVVDLFTDTGIGTRAYSIVEQGQVGWLINAKPEERRAIFEEAAGINKFKHKKTAAIRRLEATKDNLTRVNDIIGEVKRQLNSLNRQARKAERYKGFREEMRETEMTIFSLELASLTGMRAETSTRLAALLDEEMAISNSLATREGAETELRTSHLDAESEYRTARERVFELEMGIQEHERTSALIGMRIEEIRRNEERITGEIRDLTARSEAEATTITHLTRSLEELTSRMEEESGRLEAGTIELDAVSSELKRAEEEMRTVKAGCLTLSTRINDIRHSIGSLLKDEEGARMREAKARSEKVEVARALDAARGPIEELGVRLDAARHERESVASTMTETRGALERLVAERSALEGELGGAKDEHARSASRLAALEEMEKKHENLHGGARSIMQQDRSGIHGILADCIEAGPGFERAVESVLGERLQYVIVESHREGVEAIEYLTSNAAGRGSFVPVRDLRAVPVPAEAGGMGASGYIPDRARPLIGEVRVKEGFENIVNFLMGDVLLVDDLRSALDIWRQNGAYRTIVTRSGEMVDPQGVITGGVSGSAGEGILQQRAEIKTTRGEVERLEGRVHELTARLEQATTGVADTTRLLEERRDRAHAAELETLNIESELKRLKAEAARLAERDSALGAEIAEAEEKLSKTSGEKAALTHEREELEEELAGLEERSTGIAATIAGLTGKKDAASAAVTEARVSLAQTRERHGSLGKEMEARGRAVTETAERIEARRAEIEAGRAEASSKEGELTSLKSTIEEKFGSIEGLRSDEAQRRETLAGIDERIAAVERELKELKAKASDLAELKGELTIEVREIDLKVENIHERSVEKYGVRAEPMTTANIVGEEHAHSNEAAHVAHDIEALKRRRAELAERIGAIGDVNMSALEEYAEHEERHNFLVAQQTDLTSSVDSLMKAISRINRTTRERFRLSFDEINEKFKESFPRFFNGGRAELRLTEGEDILEAGIEIVAQPPGKRLQNITLLSGGEKALTATSLIFSIFLTKPSPFCLLDEVDAPLDDANIDRFNTFVRDMSKISQFLVITHNKKTMEMADTLYGVTMQEPGVSKIITLDLHEDATGAVAAVG